MIKIKKQTKAFFRSFYVSSVVAFCLFIGVYGIFTAYENTRRTGFGEYKKAVEYEDGKLRILDFYIPVRI